MIVAASSPLTKIIPGLMIWTIVFFGLTFLILKRYAFGPIQAQIDARRKRIAEAIKEADDARTEARELLEQHRALIGQAKSESAEILAETRKVADAQMARVRDEAEADRSGGSTTRASRSTRRRLVRSTRSAARSPT